MVLTDITVFNIISFVFGIAALAIPVAVSLKRGKCTLRPSVLSLSAYVMALISQLFAIGARADIQDWTGISDTIGFISSTALLVGVVIIILNCILIKIKS